MNNGIHLADDEGAKASEALLAAADAIDGEEGPT